MMSQSLTVVMPAWNEQESVDQALDNVLLALKGLVDDYEIIVIDDGSRDNTPLIVQKRAEKNPRIQCVSNDRNRGYGYSYWRGVKLARKDYVGVFPADNDMSVESFRDLVKNMERADIISSYMINPQDREWSRRTLSKLFVAVMNTTFRMRLKYFNGCFIGRRDILQALNVRSKGLTVLAECKVRLIKKGFSCLEIPFTHVPRVGGRSSALRLKSIKATLEAYGFLYWDIYWGK